MSLCNDTLWKYNQEGLESALQKFLKTNKLMLNIYDT